jgi:hypothetical protein
MQKNNVGRADGKKSCKQTIKHRTGARQSQQAKQRGVVVGGCDSCQKASKQHCALGRRHRMGRVGALTLKAPTDSCPPARRGCKTSVVRAAEGMKLHGKRPGGVNVVAIKMADALAIFV